MTYSTMYKGVCYDLKRTKVNKTQYRITLDYKGKEHHGMKLGYIFKMQARDYSVVVNSEYRREGVVPLVHHFNSVSACYEYILNCTIRHLNRLDNELQD